MNKIQQNRKIAIPNYFGEGEHIYVDQLGFDKQTRQEAKSDDFHEIFKFECESIGLNLAFYDPITDKFYGIHTESIPCRVKILPRDKTVSQYTGWQCESDTHDEGEVIAVFGSIKDVWDNLKINGDSLETVLARSYITALN